MLLILSEGVRVYKPADYSKVRPQEAKDYIPSALR